MKKMQSLILFLILIGQNYLLTTNKNNVQQVQRINKSINLNTFNLTPPRNPGSTVGEKKYGARDKYIRGISFEDLKVRQDIDIINLQVSYQFTTNSSYVNKKGQITNAEKLNHISNIIRIRSKIDFGFDAGRKGLGAKASVGSDLLGGTEFDESTNVGGAFAQENFKIDISFDYVIRK